MFFKLAARNVKRQLGSYLIYFTTVSLTVALMFAVNNFIYSEQLQEKAENLEELRTGLLAFSIFISILVAFVLCYASAFILRLRKRELGTYLTLGMTRGNILKIFLLETLLLSLAALATGIFLGLFFYQGLMMVAANLLELPMVFSAYSLGGLRLTLVLVGGVFLLCALVNAMHLRRARIYQLLHEARTVEKTVRRPFLWFLCALVSLGVMITCCILLYQWVLASAQNNQDTAAILLWGTMGLSLGVVFFHAAFARSMVYLLLRNPRFCARGTNSFVLRQLSGKLRANSFMLGAVAFLITAALSATVFAFTMKTGADASFARNNPFDLAGSFYTTREPVLSMEESRQHIAAIAGIQQEIPYTVYTTGNRALAQYTPWENMANGGNDLFISQSDYNRLYGAIGATPLALKDKFAVICNSISMKPSAFAEVELSLGAKTYDFDQMHTNMPLLFDGYYLIVVPDEALQTLAVEMNGIVYNVLNQNYDLNALMSALSVCKEQKLDGGATHVFITSDFLIKRQSQQGSIDTSAVFVIGALYCSMVFVFLAMAVLALKTLSGLIEDGARYRLLAQLGTDQALLQRTLRRQNAWFFFLPFALPMLLMIPTGIICGMIIVQTGYAALLPQIVLIILISAFIFTAIYLLYFAAAQLTAKRQIFLADSRKS